VALGSNYDYNKVSFNCCNDVLSALLTAKKTAPKSIYKQPSCAHNGTSSCFAASLGFTVFFAFRVRSGFAGLVLHTATVSPTSTTANNTKEKNKRKRENIINFLYLIN
jgi:hypothetical protein